MQPDIPAGAVVVPAPLRRNRLPEHWQTLRVLVVEDHPAYRMLVGWGLEKLGVCFEVHAQGQSALDAMNDRYFDLVLSDCQMPVMDGYTLAREIRLRERIEQRGRVPVIALTSGAGPDQLRCCREAGMDDCVIKPLTLKQLQGVLNRWLPWPQDALHQADSPVVPGVWPTRATLIETFGCAEVVERILASLMQEARDDLNALAQARLEHNAGAITHHLHRLVGSVAFLGARQLEVRGTQLISAVISQGLSANAHSLDALHEDLGVYLDHLARL